MELSLKQRHRIDRVLSRSRRREKTPLQKCMRFQAGIILSVLALILFACILMKCGWQPGNQKQIAAEFRAYKAVKHGAVDVEWK